MDEYTRLRNSLLRKLRNLKKNNIEVEIEIPRTLYQLRKSGLSDQFIETEKEELKDQLTMLPSMPAIHIDTNIISSVENLKKLNKTHIIPEEYVQKTAFNTPISNIVIENFYESISKFNENISFKLTNLVKEAIRRTSEQEVATTLLNLDESFITKLIKAGYNSDDAVQDWASSFINSLFGASEQQKKDLQDDFDLGENMGFFYE